MKGATYRKSLLEGHFLEHVASGIKGVLRGDGRTLGWRKETMPSAGSVIGDSTLNQGKASAMRKIWMPLRGQCCAICNALLFSLVVKTVNGAAFNTIFWRP